ncbi:hypothetical protein [Pelagimonas varians]|uniref:Uncharacterized protein n=1 Tax=Pelagimonas varians TaxID=696760 RepID=A0A238L2B7_9RHOB|nr:hypothetical protein [Pelagimonas varians]PYG26741.1 hypothetical protein C8N36_12084 [Pelagimonas varians]SMX49234.1 hypothetical protein PEV8663_04139 [Pelagimonas varians]
MLQADGLFSEAMQKCPHAWALFDAAEAQHFLSETKTLLDAKAYQEAVCMTQSQLYLFIADEIIVPAVLGANERKFWILWQGKLG